MVNRWKQCYLRDSSPYLSVLYSSVKILEVNAIEFHIIAPPGTASNWASILVQVTIYCKLRIGRDEYLDLSEAHDNNRNLYENTASD